MTETEHRIPVADGERVAAVHHEASGDKWLVFCHGFLSDKTGSYEHRCRRAVEHGYDAIRFDFRGCGDSDGRFVEGTLSAKLEDLRAVLDHFDPSSVALFGSSFGGKVAFHAVATDDRVERVVIFHGADDESVPLADSFEAAASLETDVLLERFAGEGHRFSPAAEERLLERTFHWLTRPQS